MLGSRGTILSLLPLLHLLSPFVGRVVVFDAALHVLQLIQDSKHVNELAQRKEIGLRDEVFPPLSMAQALHLAAEPLNGLALQRSGTWSSRQQVLCITKPPMGPSSAHPPPPSFNESFF